MALGNRFRYVIAAFIFISTLSIYIGRINLSTAIVEMAKKPDTNQTILHLVDVCQPDGVLPQVNGFTPKPNKTTREAESTSSSQAEKFDWNQKTQGLILGAFYWGYVLFQVPGGRLAEKVGPRILATGGMVITGCVNLLTPFIARYYILFLISRIVLGGAQAMVFPSSFCLISKWIPDNERSTVISLTASGGAIGIIITAAMSGYLAKHGFAGGWPSVFYVSGAINVALGLIYFFTVRNDPQEHPFVSSEEVEYIVENVAALKSKRSTLSETEVAKKGEGPPPFPWIKVLTCRPVIAQVIVKVSVTWAYNLVILKAPAYMEKVLQMPLEENGAFSSAAFLSFALSHLIGGMIADYIIRRQCFSSKTPVRKIFEGMCAFGTGAFLALIPFVGCDRTLFLLVLIASQASFGMQAGGELPLPSDWTHEFTGTLFAIGNMFAMITGIVCPYIAGIVLDMEPSMPKRQWTYIMAFTALFSIFGGLVFVIFGSADRQNWGYDQEEKGTDIESVSKKGNNWDDKDFKRFSVIN